MVNRYLRYGFIILGVVVAFGIIYLTVVNVRRIQDRQVLATKLDCQYNWCKAQLSQNGNLFVLSITSPFTKKYTAVSFNVNLSQYLHRSVQVKGVVKNDTFYVIDLKDI